jgi:hypothetical protein
MTDIAWNVDLPDPVVAVAGDWHGNTAWIQKALGAFRRADPLVTTVLHLGDLWTSPPVLRTIDSYAQRFGFERVLLTAGNHELWNKVTPALDAAGGLPARLSKFVWALPRPYRFTIGGREILSLGGAASIDRAWRVAGVEWWPDEAITDAMVDEAVAGGSADVMLVHETPDRTPVQVIQSILSTNPLGFPAFARYESGLSRRQVDRVWGAVRPRLLMHGHMHLPGAGTTPDGRRVVSFGMDGQPRNLALLDLSTLELTDVSVARSRAR